MKIKTTEEIMYEYVSEEDHCLRIYDINPNVQWVKVEDLKKFINNYQTLYDNNELGFDEFNEDLNNALTSNSANAKTNKDLTENQK